MFIWLIVLIEFIIIYKLLKKYERPLEMRIYFGIPGCGKTTFAAYTVNEMAKHGIPVYSNVPITGAYKISISDIGIYDLRDCHLIIDEAGIDYCNRDFKKLRVETIRYYKYHRHYKVSVDCLSQSFEDMDIVLRRLCQKYFLLKRSLIPGVTLIKPIRKYIGIDKTTKQIIDQYEFYKWYQFKNKRILRRKHYWRFNSWSTPKLEEKTFEKW